MKAIVHREFGSADALELVDRPVPEPGPGEVRVRVHVSGVNPTDWKNRSGRSAAGMQAADEMVPNQDGAGVVDAIGAGVEGLAVGDRVWLYLAAHTRPHSGTAQQFTVVPRGHVVPLPDSASFEVGASLGVPAVTAHRALTINESGPSRLSPDALAGRTVLVAGGAGAVGHAAIQLARWAGARVITTVSSPAKAALATAAGADLVIDYRTEDVVARVREFAPDLVDTIVEVSPAANTGIDADVLAPNGAVAVYATDGGREAVFDVARFFAKNARVQFILLYTLAPHLLAAAADDIVAALRDGALHVGEEAGLPVHRFTLEETGAAHRAVEEGVVGKALISLP